MLSPNFYNEITELVDSIKVNLTIFDIGFYNGEFSKSLLKI